MIIFNIFVGKFLIMHKYKVEFKYTEGGNSKSIVEEFTYPKRVYALSDNSGQDGRDILGYVAELKGLNPAFIDHQAGGGWNKLKYLGEVNEKGDKNEKKSSKSFWTPVWAIPFKILWWLIKKILWAVTLGALG